MRLAVSLSAIARYCVPLNLKRNKRLRVTRTRAVAVGVQRKLALCRTVVCYEKDVLRDTFPGFSFFKLSKLRIVLILS